MEIHWLAWQQATCVLSSSSRRTLQIEHRPLTEALTIAEQRAPHELQQAVLPIYITTKDDLRKYGIDQSIWIRVKEMLEENVRVRHTFAKTRCLENISVLVEE